ncbi:MAG: heme biosynthesis protein HemY [Paracoccaceae bacterium]
MIASLLKILVFVAAVAAAIWAAARLIEMPGGLTIQAMGYEVALSPLQAVIAVIVLLIVAWIVLLLVRFLIALFHFLNGDETAISRWFRRGRRQRGMDALEEGMMALAEGDGPRALERATKADRYLDKPELTGVLTAQAAEMAGDGTRAEGAWRKLLDYDRTRFAGVRGLMRRRLAEGDTDTALALARKAHDLRPAHGETSDTLLRLQANDGDWSGARATLAAKHRNGTVPRDLHRRRDAVLALSEAREVWADGQSIEARETAIEANRLSPDLVPAAVLAARGYLAEGKPKYATRVVQKAWEVRPHPDLATVFAEIAPQESPQERLRRFRPLLKAAQGTPEGRMLEAELHMAAEDFPAARRAIGDLTTGEPDARALTLMAAIERGSGASDAVVRGWLARALTAPRGPGWVCENCGAVHAEWMPVCSGCGAFDTIAWAPLPDGRGAIPKGTEMLPMIVGGPESDPARAVATAAATPPMIDVSDAEPTETMEREAPAAAVVADAEPAEDTPPPGHVR